MFKGYVILISILNMSQIFCFDLTIAGKIRFADGIGRLPIIWIDSLKDVFKINFVPTTLPIDLNNISYSVQQIITNHDKTPGKVCVFLDLLWYKYSTPSVYAPKSNIRIAYSMLEASAIPVQWSHILNNLFDAVVVPDKFLIDVYKNSGVKIPIFVLPCMLYLKDFLSRPLKTKANKPFTFGVSAEFIPRKNLKILLESFGKEFGGNPNFKLKMHGRIGDTKELTDIIKTYKIHNIEIINQSLSQTDYINFMSSLDCYVFISKGEGFSITPREAMALGIPCILSNNTAHITLCNTGLVKAVNAYIQEPAYYDVFGAHCGHYLSVDELGVRKAMREMYNNYSLFLEKAPYARQWVRKYDRSQLKARYINLISPVKVILGNKNIVTSKYLMTNSQSLYLKYKKLNKN